MLKFDPFKKSSGPLAVLCLGAHSDDIEIGCGGAILRLLAAAPDASVTWVVLSAAGARRKEAEESAAAFLRRAEDRTVVLKEFRDGFFPYVGYDVKEYFEELKQELSPDVVFTHCRGDLHQDHRVVNELTWNTFRDHFILEYEIPKYDGDLGVPNFFVHLDQPTCDEKVDLIWKHFATQREKHWLSRENLMALLRMRGIESRSPTGFAEAFHARKVVY